MDTEARLQKVNRMLRAVTRTNYAILHIRHDRKELLREICRIMLQERDYVLAWVGEIQADKLCHPIACAGPPGSMKQINEWVGKQATLRQTAAEQAIRQKKTIVATCPQGPLHKPDVAPWITAAVPIQITGEVIAVLNACAYDEDVFNKEELALLEELAADIGLALKSIDVEKRTKEAEDALRISEQRFRRLSEHSQVGIILIQNNIYRYVNPAFAEMFGYSHPEEIINKLTPLDLAAPESRSLVTDKIGKRIDGSIRATKYKFKGLRKDGSTFDVEEYGARTVHAHRLAVIATVVDITERERATEQLKALSEAGLALSRVRTPEEALNHAVQLALNIVVTGEAANIYLIKGQRLKLAVHAGYDQQAKHTPPSEQKSSPLDTIPTFRKMIETRSPLLIKNTQQSDLWSPRSENDVVRSYLATPLIVRGEIIGFLNVDSYQEDSFNTSDVQHLRLFADHVAATIEHLRLIDSLKEERLRLTILNKLSQKLSETLRPREVAERALAHIGEALGTQSGIIYMWKAEIEILTVIAAQSINEDDIPTINQKLLSAPNSVTKWVAKNRQALLIMDIKQDARRLVVSEIDPQIQSVLNVPLEVQGELIGVLSLLSKDVNAFSKNDQQMIETLSVPVALALQNAHFFQASEHQAMVMKEALERKEELDRMKDELIQNISHELRTPLALVMGYAEMLKEGALGPIAAEQMGAIDIIARRSRMLRGLVENITLSWQLEREKQEQPNFENLDLCKVVETITQEFQTQAGKLNLNLVADTPECPVFIWGIPIQIHRLLDNLTGNALKFTPTDGKIRIQIIKQKNKAILSICDTGIGIPANKQEQIFERFYQIDGSSKRRYGGVGLGLALVKAIVEFHHGTIKVESPATEDPNYPGTCIQIQFPLVEPKASTP